MTEPTNIVDPGALEKPCAIQAFREAGDTLALCRRLRQIGVIVGTTGTGKTTAAKAHADAHGATTVYMRLPVFAATPQPFLVRLCRAAGLPHAPHMGKAELAEELIGFLRAKPGVLVIIDEANHMTPELVHVVRELWDEARCGFVLVGTPDMEALWAERSGKRSGAGDAFAAFRARIGQRLPMPKPDASDVTALCQHMGLSGKREHDLIARCLKGGIGLHSVEQLLSNARAVAGEGEAVAVEHLFLADTMARG
ncbi:AAA family ATPase [Azospirillum agricola]|uniref:AAA family ATPase n=1 Tax=Azospirillum agricola TaxID=1720247 RepID=UPI000A0EF0A3|nr:AAA family ATPase [Azospirillum agricola]SMH32046.1 Mu B transposition protein, C terminal [Azospirillum lipoferum]